MSSSSLPRGLILQAHVSRSVTQTLLHLEEGAITSQPKVWVCPGSKRTHWHLPAIWWRFRFSHWQPQCILVIIFIYTLLFFFFQWDIPIFRITHGSPCRGHSSGCMRWKMPNSWCQFDLVQFRKRKRDAIPFLFNAYFFPILIYLLIFVVLVRIFFFFSLGLVCWSKLLSQRRRRRHRWPPEFEGVLPKVKRRDICFFPFVWLYFMQRILEKELKT